MPSFNPVRTATLVGVAAAIGIFFGTLEASAHYSHSSYSYDTPECRRSDITDPVGIIVSGPAGFSSADVAGATWAYTKDGKDKWFRNGTPGEGTQYGLDHGNCTKFEEANTTSKLPSRSRYHVRWDQGSTPLDNGRWYVAGTPHYDYNCIGHKIASWQGPRDRLASAFKANGWDIYYVHKDIDNSLVERHEPCAIKVNIDGWARWDDQIVWVRP